MLCSPNLAFPEFIVQLCAHRRCRPLCWLLQSLISAHRESSNCKSEIKHLHKQEWLFGELTKPQDGMESSLKMLHYLRDKSL